MTNAENLRIESCLQRDSAEHEEYAGAQSAAVREGREADGADLLERTLCARGPFKTSARTGRTCKRP